jgi:hypothetical protein
MIFISCGDNKQDQGGTTGTTNQEYVLPSSLNNQQQQTNSSPNSTSETIDMQPVKTEQLTVNPGNANVKLNPAHGEPGHRCDIAVGAPLEGSVQPTTNSQSNTQPVTSNSNAKLNPAHGEPGHRCDIAVGAPLDGSVKPTTTNAQTTQPVITAPDNGSKTPTNSNAKLNPAHGQPGHRCDIAVGAPLDGATATKTAVQKTDVKNPLQYFPTIQKVDPSKSGKTDSSKN